MVWIILVLACIACWSTTDLFYKKGSDYEDRLSHLKFFGGIKSRYNGASVTVDISVTFSPDTRFEAISQFQKELQEELSREIKNCSVAVVIDNSGENM